jgi:hypothetical protein
MEETAPYSPAAAGGKSRRHKPVAKKRPLILHELKSEPGPFSAVWDGRKLAEVRNDDRGFIVGQLIILREMEGPQPVGGEPVYTGRYLAAEITHITKCDQWMGLAAGGFVVLSIKVSATGRLP